MYHTIISGAFQGLESYLVYVEVDVSDGLPCMEMIGYLTSETKESKERVRVGIKNSGYNFPPKRITISFSPSDIRKDGSGFDLPVALGILMADKKASQKAAPNTNSDILKYSKKTLVIGEVGLDGSVKPVKGILPILLRAEKEGIRYCILPKENLLEAENVRSIASIPVENIREASEIYGDILEGVLPGRTKKSPKIRYEQMEEVEYKVDFSQIYGQQHGKRAAEIAASGFHNLLLFGPPGSGKSMIAERIRTILPPMTYQESLEVTQIYSIAGLLDNKTTLVTERPFEEAHHTITPQALVGGGFVPRPGMITRAHKGVLFLDELPEFGREKLDLLRQPLEEKVIRIARNHYVCDYQADFMLVAAMNPCPCGYFPDYNRCNCSKKEIMRYMKRISGPLLNRIDISVQIGKIEWKSLELETRKTEDIKLETSKEIRGRVSKAKELQFLRQNKFNSDLTNEEVAKICRMDRAAEKLMKYIFDKKQLSIRSCQRIRKVARTIADMDGSDLIRELHLSEAVVLNNGLESLKR